MSLGVKRLVAEKMCDQNFWLDICWNCPSVDTDPWLELNTLWVGWALCVCGSFPAHLDLYPCMQGLQPPGSCTSASSFDLGEGEILPAEELNVMHFTAVQQLIWTGTVKVLLKCGVCVCVLMCVCVCLSCVCCIVQCEWREGVGADVAGHGMLCPQHQPAARADAVPANPITSHRHWLLESAAENTQVSSRQFITKFGNFCWILW